MENIKTRITMASSIYTAVEGQLIYSFFPYRRLLSHFPVLVMASLRTASTCCFLCMLRASKNTLMYVQYEAMIRLLLALKLMLVQSIIYHADNVNLIRGPTCGFQVFAHVQTRGAAKRACPPSIYRSGNGPRTL